LPIANGGTGLTTTPANGALDIGNGTGFTRTTLTAGTGVTITNASGAITINATGTGGTVTSVAASVPSFLSIAGSPITTSGTLAISLSGTALPTTSGGTGLTSFTSGGVVYASSSSALATGSALTFDGTQIATLKSSSGPLFTFNDTTTAFGAVGSQLAITGAGAVDTFIVTSTNGKPLNLRAPTGQYISFDIASTEALRLTSSSLYTASGINVGIGTSSPSYKLQVKDGSVGVTSADGTVTSLVNYNSIGTVTNSAFNIVTNSTDRLVVSASGNLGLGVTPSAWFSTSRAIQVGSGGAIEGRSNFEPYISTTSNAYLNTAGAYKYIATAEATRYLQDSGTHKFYTAASGTAGADISFTQAMTLDASGNLAVGTTTTSLAKITASSSGSNQTGIRLNNSSSATDNYISIDFGLQDFALSSGYGCFIRGYNSGGISYASYLTFGTTNGASAPTERARIDSSGNLLVGKTNSTGVNAGVVLTPTGGFTLTRTGTSASDQVIFYRGTAGSEVYVGTITTTGTATSYVTSSDYRLKNSVAPMTGALAKVALLKPCTYKWNVDGSDGQGFIAHELAEVCPDAVSGEKDAVDADGKPQYQGIDTSFLVATLTAAIQELKAEFDAYKASHP
jgi:hypothetical protein